MKIVEGVTYYQGSEIRGMLDAHYDMEVVVRAYAWDWFEVHLFRVSDRGGLVDFAGMVASKRTPMRARQWRSCSAAIRFVAENTDRQQARVSFLKPMV